MSLWKVQHFPRDLANVNEWKIMFDHSSLTKAYNSLYFNVCPSNLSFVVLSLQLKLEKPVLAHVQSILNVK